MMAVYTYDKERHQLRAAMEVGGAEIVKEISVPLEFEGKTIFDARIAGRHDYLESERAKAVFAYCGVEHNAGPKQWRWIKKTSFAGHTAGMLRSRAEWEGKVTLAHAKAVARQESIDIYQAKQDMVLGNTRVDKTRFQREDAIVATIHSSDPDEVSSRSELDALSEAYACARLNDLVDDAQHEKFERVRTMWNEWDGRAFPKVGSTGTSGMERAWKTRNWELLHDALSALGSSDTITQVAFLNAVHCSPDTITQVCEWGDAVATLAPEWLPMVEVAQAVKNLMYGHELLQDNAPMQSVVIEHSYVYEEKWLKTGRRSPFTNTITNSPLAYDEYWKMVQAVFNREYTGFQPGQRLEVEDVLAQVSRMIEAKIEAKNGLENYCYSMRNTLSEEKLKDKFEGHDKDKIDQALQKTLDWLAVNQMAETDEFDAKQKELEAVVNPIMTKVDGGSDGSEVGTAAGGTNAEAAGTDDEAEAADEAENDPAQDEAENDSGQENDSPNSPNTRKKRVSRRASLVSFVSCADVGDADD